MALPLSCLLFIIAALLIDGYQHPLIVNKRYKHSRNLFTSKSDTFNPYRIIKTEIPFTYKEVPNNAVLLAVDMGLRSGFALYNSSGSLIDFTDHKFLSLPTLKESILEVLNCLSVKHHLTNFVLEGDAVYGEIWRTSIEEFGCKRNEEMDILFVSPSEWRESLLTLKERKSGQDAKTAARQICRQIMWRSGHYASHDKLKWPSHRFNSNDISNIDDDNQNSNSDTNSKGINMKGLFSIPLIERYSNGNVILPPKQNKQSSQ